MARRRLTAQPIREGVSVSANGEYVVFVDYRWNTGEITRRWFADESTVDPKTLILHDIPKMD